MKIGSNPFLV